MRILVLGMNYLPESASIGPYTAGLAEYLVARGHDVRVVTSFPMAPQWRIWEGYRGEWWRREMINGVPVLRTYVYVPADPRRAMRRVAYDMSFMVSSFCGAMFSGPSDVILAISPPLQLGLTAWLAGVFKRAPVCLHLQDLVPDAAVATGQLADPSTMLTLARRLERFVYRRARRISVICEGFRANLVDKHVPASKIDMLPNYIDLDFMQPHGRDNAFRHRQGISPADFLVMYSGSIALKQGLEMLVDVAERLSADPSVKFMIVGEGPPLGALQAAARDRRLSNLTFLPFQPRPTLPEQLAAADALVITQRPTVRDVVFPGKLLYYMAAGRPILAAVSADSETGRFISTTGVGLVTPPEDPEAMAAAIARLRAGDAAAMGRRGRAEVEARFASTVVLPAFASCLETLAE
ncbi:MAG: WcaI family glycosyltransferase [Vicinamibacterales bacterium]